MNAEETPVDPRDVYLEHEQRLIFGQSFRCVVHNRVHRIVSAGGGKTKLQSCDECMRDCAPTEESK